jgi:hypothetical protein
MSETTTAALDLTEDAGWLDVTVLGEGGERLARRLDVFELNDRVYALEQGGLRASSGADYWAGVSRALADCGLPAGLSHGAARKVWAAALARIDELKKNDGSPAASPGSTPA